MHNNTCPLFKKYIDRSSTEDYSRPSSPIVKIHSSGPYIYSSKKNGSYPNKLGLNLSHNNFVSFIMFTLTAAKTSSRKVELNTNNAYFSSTYDDSRSYLYSKYFLTRACKSFGISFDFRNYEAYPIFYRIIFSF